MYDINLTATTIITTQGVFVKSKKNTKWNHEKYSVNQKEDRERGGKKQQIRQIENKGDSSQPSHINIRSKKWPTQPKSKICKEANVSICCLEENRFKHKDTTNLKTKIKIYKKL